MPASQLERLKNDISTLDTYINKIKKRGDLNRVKILLKKKLFIEERIAAVI